MAKEQAGSLVAVLTPREREVLDQVARGSSNKQFAAALAITENTVKSHLKNLLEKLHLENRVQAATFSAPRRPDAATLALPIALSRARPRRPKLHSFYVALETSCVIDSQCLDRFQVPLAALSCATLRRTLCAPQPIGASRYSGLPTSPYIHCAGCAVA